VICVAAEVLELPAWSALIVHVPADPNANSPPLVVVQTPDVDDVNTIVNAEVDVAVSVGVVPKFFDPGFAKVIVWASFGVTPDDATEALPAPTLLVAVRVKV
jgi:uncharacterized membrane protein